MNHRIFVEKKDGYNSEAKKLLRNIQLDLKIKGLTDLRLLNIYEVFNISHSVFEEAKKILFSERQVDNLYTSIDLEDKNYLAYEVLPGQFDQRAHSAIQCLNILSKDSKETQVKCGKLLIFYGDITRNDIKRIERYCINPVEMRIKKLDNLKQEDMLPPKDVIKYNGFIDLSDDSLKDFLKDNSLAMSIEDLALIREYFKSTEKRDPTETEIKVFDTYWSDHCRHTTFETELTKVSLEDGWLKETFEELFHEYLENRKEVYDDKKKDISLMDMATISQKLLKKQGILTNVEESDEVNACSVKIEVEVDGRKEPWLLMFKNETHNHPTEIEPFGGASTCLGGAIRDPLSGRSYVYQAIRVSGAGDPLEDLEKTIEGKLPQKKITTEAAKGYSSYGNQIGIPTSHVSEIFHKGYKAKRMEVGAVVGAAPLSSVRRNTPSHGDLIILLGGKTGRDGCGGATGSSKKHDLNSLNTCGAEVQKGNAPEERKIQRLFRNPNVTTLIKKSNDFGAGGVSVAIGELADGVTIDLNNIPVKYQGLNGTELAISESQERMAVVIDSNDKDRFLELVSLENIEASIVAKVTKRRYLTMTWNDKVIVDLSRDFLDLNGFKRSQDVVITSPNTDQLSINKYNDDLNPWVEMMENLNIVSQKGLMEMFDSSIGAGSILMPFGGRYQMTPTDISIQKIPVLNGSTTTASGITWGYNPKISSWSPLHGGAYSVVESVAKIVAAGGNYKDIHLSFQEYFRRLENDPKNWGEPFKALLGTIYAQNRFKLAAIGGKDSMSGSFEDLHVPPTLISFAVAPMNTKKVLSPEFKKVSSKVYLFKHNMLDNCLPNIEELIKNYDFIYENNDKILSAQVIKEGGIAEAIFKMSLGNKIGFKFNCNEDLFNSSYGSIIVEVSQELDFEGAILLGETTEKFVVADSKYKMSIEFLQDLWLKKLEKVFPYKEEKIKLHEIEVNSIKDKKVEKMPLQKGNTNTNLKPTVFIPIFPGTNCEYDSIRAFHDAGAHVETMVFRNQNAKEISESLSQMASHIKKANILMLAGGFSAGDEPDGSGKFIANILNNSLIKTATEALIERDGLILGVCNGFQALIKSGLLPYGRIGEVMEDSPTLTYNKIGRHISQMVTTRVSNNESPWLSSFSVGEHHRIPVSHGEGRFVAPTSTLKRLIENKQIATQYVDLKGDIATEFKDNPNGSMLAIEGITSPDGRIYGKMGHSERYGDDLYKNIEKLENQKIFTNGVNYFLNKWRDEK